MAGMTELDGRRLNRSMVTAALHDDSPNPSDVLAMWGELETYEVQWCLADMAAMLAAYVTQTAVRGIDPVALWVTIVQALESEGR